MGPGESEQFAYSLDSIQWMQLMAILSGSLRFEGL